MDFMDIKSIIHGFWNSLTKSIKIHMDYGFFMEYAFRILKNMDFGMNMDLVSNPSDPLHTCHIFNIRWNPSYVNKAVHGYINRMDVKQYPPSR